LLSAGWPKLEFVGLKALHGEILNPATADHNANNRRKLHDSGTGELAISARDRVRRDAA
jgi:hypothetical protein